MKTKFYLIGLLFFVLQFQLRAQEEFFKNTYGITLGGTTNFESVGGAGLSLYFKDNFFLSGTIAGNSSAVLSGFGLGMFFTGSNPENTTKGVFSLSLINQPYSKNIIDINVGLLQIFLKESKFPFSLSLIFNQSLIGSGELIPVLGYTQTLFSHWQIYPVIGMSYYVPFNEINNLEDDGYLFFNVGLNIKLNKKKSSEN